MHVYKVEIGYRYNVSPIEWRYSVVYSRVDYEKERGREGRGYKMTLDTFSVSCPLEHVIKLCPICHFKQGYT